MKQDTFLDCGSHYGEGLWHFIDAWNIDNSWKVHCWEPNPFTFSKLQENFSRDKPQFKLHNEAVWIKDETITFNIETPAGEGDTGQGSSLLDLKTWQPWSNSLSFNKKVDVPAIDFSAWVRDNIDAENENVRCKMDIEGGEFDVLEKLINEETVFSIKLFYVEFHSHFMAEDKRDEFYERERKIKDFFEKNKSKTLLIDWH